MMADKLVKIFSQWDLFCELPVSSYHEFSASETYTKLLLVPTDFRLLTTPPVYSFWHSSRATNYLKSDNLPSRQARLSGVTFYPRRTGVVNMNRLEKIDRLPPTRDALISKLVLFLVRFCKHVRCRSEADFWVKIFVFWLATFDSDWWCFRWLQIFFQLHCFQRDFNVVVQ